MYKVSVESRVEDMPHEEHKCTVSEQTQASRRKAEAPNGISGSDVVLVDEAYDDFVVLGVEVRLPSIPAAEAPLDVSVEAQTTACDEVSSMLSIWATSGARIHVLHNLLSLLGKC
jgi:hypothetical protein